MTDEKIVPAYGFRIKWGGNEVEFFGDASKELFLTVFEQIKNTPTIRPPKEQEPQVDQGTVPQNLDNDPSDESEPYRRISVDCGVDIIQVKKTLSFDKRQDFPYLVPMIVSHPKERDAVRLTAYAMQVGLKKQMIEQGQLKQTLVGPNNYQLPGSTLGSILMDFKKSNFISFSTAQGRNRPFSLTKEGLDLARDLIRKT